MARPGTTTLRDYYVSNRMARFTYLRTHDGPDERRRSWAYRATRPVVDANSRMVDRILGVPARIEENWVLLRDARQRRLLWRALVDEHALTAPRRRAILSILLWTGLLAWALAGIVIAFLDRGALSFYQAGYSLFFYSFATSVFLPTPFEFLLAASVGRLGVFWTVAIAAAAKTFGSWVVLLMGDKAHQGLEQVLGRRGVLARLFAALTRFAQRYGYLAIFVLFAVPFMSDTAPLFVLAVLRMKKARFLAVMFLAIVVRSLLFLVLGGTIRILP